jgi:hypothetical protein
LESPPFGGLAELLMTSRMLLCFWMIDGIALATVFKPFAAASAAGCFFFA